MRLALVISSLKGGGAERVMTHLANGWVERGNTVSFATFDVKGAASYVIDSRIDRFDIEPAASAIPPVRIWDRVVCLRNWLRQWSPDAIISFGDKTNVQTLLAARGLPAPVVISERSDPLVHRISRGWRVLRKWTYPGADALVVQTETVRNWASRRFPVLPTTIIGNPVVAKTLSGVERQPLIVAAGRLSAEKQFDLLIRAFHRVAERFPDWRLEIIGEGPDRAALEEHVAERGLQSRISLPGFVSNASARMEQAGVFALSSRYEGLPNALIEAMAGGAPVLATNCSGAAAIIRDDWNGRLTPVGDEQQMAERLGELMARPDDRRRLGAAAMAVREQFRLTKVLDLWEDTLRECLEKRRSPHLSENRTAA